MILPVSFFEQDTLAVAKALLGKTLHMYSTAGCSLTQWHIVETEAYTQHDPACHAFGKTTGRSATLYKRAGLAYVYFIYGMYHCLNVVTEPQGVGGAVLIRALAPLSQEWPQGVALQPSTTPSTTRLSAKQKALVNTHGPGRLCKALGITKAQHNEVDMTSPNSPLQLHDAAEVPANKIVTTTRIGIQKAADYPWRFYIKDNPWVSVQMSVN